ncbi:Gfo/Idh/MocA family protein [Nocardioides sp. cx-173]|uniref:Gfo/Idh/MocA family protein n=1 Tax=Nocardioides sp. cx-173 TaxID=2898796 RepID=UPI001E3B973F|nr:Gfo/Idh/MocA family oxidoreductase [Nocardioides sp. cx-173]MCD4523678.1 Gfo/Idh/MocA family oxidoreductase [Nocardioides sp. cx-173]UGB41992.1 Gfo/Idh/MocA family oxidoreductase [Nocardioides sp. cx-173]
MTPRSPLGAVRTGTRPSLAGRAAREPVGVGVVGLSASGGWGATAHLPAMSAAGGFELRGLVAGSPASSRAAGDRYGAPAYPTVVDLAAADDIDLVVLTVKTPRHRELVLPAADTGKPIFCEWPFAVSHPEAVEMSGRAAGLDTFVGLHGRSSPQFRLLADLVGDGYVGRVLSATVLSRVSEWGSPVSEDTEYLLDREQGATMISIGLGHAIDPVLSVLGELSDVVATAATHHRQVPVAPTGRLAPMTGDDQIAISGTLAGGAVLSAHQRGGTASRPGFSLVIDGTEGTLEASAGNHPHIAPLTIRGGRRGRPLESMALPEGYDAFPELKGTAIHSLAHAYAGIRQRLGAGTSVVPDFSAAVVRHRLLDAISQSARTGLRIAL